MKKKILAIVLAITLVIGFAPVDCLPQGLLVIDVGAEASGDYRYKILEDGTVEIAKYVGSDFEITIPSSIEGRTVSSIGEKIIFDRYISSITIPDSVTYITDNAFENEHYSSLIIKCNLNSFAEQYSNGKNIHVEYIDTELFEDYSYHIQDDGTVIIRKYTGNERNLIIPKSVNGFQVTKVGSWAFTRCNNIESIIIPDSVISIGGNAFSYCSSLTSVTIPDGVTIIGESAFSSCTSLTSITIPDGVTSIGDNAFRSCSRLTSITIPDGVTSIGDYAFCGCSSLTSITIPDGVTSIGNYALYNCIQLYNINIPDNVTSIGDRAFYNCLHLNNLSIPDSVSCIGELAFYETGWYFNQSDGVVYAGKVAYAYKGEMPENTSIVIKDGTKAINDDAFSWCQKLTSVTLPEGVTNIGNWAFGGCSNLTSITLPDSVTNIGDSAFSGCSSLTNITTIPDSVTSIGDFAFSSCGSLTNIAMPNSVTSIGYYAFGNCRNLTSINIPDSVTSIGERAFEYCSSLTIKCNSTSYAAKYAKENDINYSFLDAKSNPFTLTCANVTYGTALSPKTTGVKGGAKIVYYYKVKGSSDKTYTKTKPTKAGTYTVKAVSAATENYKSTSKTVYVTIAKKSISAMKATLSTTNYTYSGTAKKPSVTLKNGTKTLKLNTDFTVSYANNTKKGTATVTITGKGNYSGTIKKTFTIKAKAISSCTFSSISAKAYTGKAITPAVTIKNGTKTLVKNTDYTVKYTNNTKTGKATVTITGKGNYSGTKTIYFNIKPKATTISTVSSPKTKTAKITWKKDTMATGYQVVMATSKTGKYTSIKTTTANGSVSYTKTGLTKGKTYYFKVRSYKTINGVKVYGAYSSIKSVKVK